MAFNVIIPARYGSTRFPGKPLAELAGKPMIVHVCERAARSGAQAVHVATDDTRIGDAVDAAGFRVIMTRSDHASGTDRLAEAAGKLVLPDGAVVVNVQGDEPLIDPALIGDVAATLECNPDASVSTACHPLHDLDDAFNPNVVKVVLDARGHALYFSRAPIPWARDAYAEKERKLPAGLPCFRHLGIYGYRAGFLRRYAALEPSPLEHHEALEQLRVLWHGHRIAVTITTRMAAPGVDSPQDLERVRRLLGEAN